MDREEADECRKMHQIVKRYDMHDCFRWIVAQARGRWGCGRAQGWTQQMQDLFAEELCHPPPLPTPPTHLASLICPALPCPAPPPPLS